MTPFETALPEPAIEISSVKPKKWRAQLDWGESVARTAVSLQVLWLCATSSRRRGLKTVPS